MPSDQNTRTQEAERAHDHEFRERASRTTRVLRGLGNCFSALFGKLSALGRSDTAQCVSSDQQLDEILPKLTSALLTASYRPGDVERARVPRAGDRYAWRPQPRAPRETQESGVVRVGRTDSEESSQQSG